MKKEDIDLCKKVTNEKIQIYVTFVTFWEAWRITIRLI